MLFRWFPWRFVIGRVARASGLLDPVKVLSRLEGLGQPLEVKEPLEMLRSGLVFHARGLLNTGVIQHNLDWIWPYWVMRQYNPHDPSFIPRAFSATHINLTHRNWTAIGLPDCDELPIVDPAGLLTPFWDGWSLDTWVLAHDGGHLLPSRLVVLDQWLEMEPQLTVVTRSSDRQMQMESRAWVERSGDQSVCRLRVEASAPDPARLVFSARPCNPEGVSFLHRIRAEGDTWHLDDSQHQDNRRVEFAETPESTALSDYRRGDVYAQLQAGSCGSGERQVACHVGIATAAACFELDPGVQRRVDVSIPLGKPSGKTFGAAGSPRPKQQTWEQALAGSCQLRVPDARFQLLFDAAIRSILLHSAGEVVPGPYTYRRFWFRDAVFILHALASMGFEDRTARHLATFPGRQSRNGFFRSQDNEWDSNGEVLWLLSRFCRLTGRHPDRAWRQAVLRGARWIADKRLPSDLEAPHAGLLPAGFSAEHLGANDFYFWDDFWSVAGLRGAGELLETWGDDDDAARFRHEADDLEGAIEDSLTLAAERLGRPAMPAAPSRRLDPGAIGSLAAGYPLELMASDDPRLLDTVSFLVQSCFVNGGFFQDLIHSGINPYLTLHVAQVLLRVGDLRCLDLYRTVADLASPTGQWPEAVHPRTGGGCMGDGHHVWASAEWLMMTRNAFVREGEDGLILGSGVLPEWLQPKGTSPVEIRFGPAPTPWGPMTVEISPRATDVEVRWHGEWRGPAPVIEVRLPGYGAVTAEPDQQAVEVQTISETP